MFLATVVVGVWCAAVFLHIAISMTMTSAMRSVTAQMQLGSNYMLKNECGLHASNDTTRECTGLHTVAVFSTT